MKITAKEVRRYFSKPKNLPILLLAAIALIGLLISGYFAVVYKVICTTDECFSINLVNCKKATYIKESPETILQYQITGKSQETCRINVRLLQIKKGSVELADLQGEEMDCFIPLGVYTEPEKDIKNCHGLLKERIQEIIIQRMHSEIIENIGKVSKGISDVL